MTPFIRLLEVVRALAAQYPHRRTADFYWSYEMGAPESVIGAALYQLNQVVPLEDNWRDVRTMPWIDMGFDHIYGPQLHWLRLVQELSDCTWAEAVLRADTVFPFAQRHLTVVP